MRTTYLRLYSADFEFSGFNLRRMGFVRLASPERRSLRSDVIAGSLLGRLSQEARVREEEK